jgi:hypothetical protein
VAGKIQLTLNVQTEMETIAKPKSADENNARLDRLFDRIYRLYGGSLKAFFDQLKSVDKENDEQTSSHLFTAETCRKKGR